MTLDQIEELIEDTRKLPHAGDRVALATALGTLEVARQLTLLNRNVAEQKKSAGAGKK